MRLATAIGSIIVAILFFFGFIFAIASSAGNTVTRLIVAGMLFLAGFAIVLFLSRQPKTMVQKVELSGQMQAVALKCPNCSASVDAGRIKIVSGVPYATCAYCGHTFQVSEEPKW